MKSYFQRAKGWVQKSEVAEASIILLSAVLAAEFAVALNAFESLYHLAEQYGHWQIGQIISGLFCIGLGFMVLSSRRSRQLRREIAQREAAEEKARALARHDALTGLPNRRVFQERLNRSLARAKRGTAYCAVLLIDLDRFKPINDLYGHAAGDAVLCEIASRLKHMARQSETLARLGGDEFAAVIEFAPGEDAPIRLAKRIISMIGEPIIVGSIQAEIGATIGIALYPNDGTDAEALLRAADLAMYSGKREGRGCFRFFEHSMDAQMRARAALESELRQAVASGEIAPHYQPLVSLQDQKLLGFEILARWYHPRKGIIAPDVFIPVAEETGLISEMTFHVLRRACLEARTWPSHLTLALNVSPTQLKDRMLPQHLLAVLSETGFAPGRLEIEITESALVGDLDAAKSILGSLQNIGVRTALDDFGTGYSSLYHLRELKFDKLKIDRSFVQSLDNAESAKIVNAIVGLGKSLGLLTTAEGIEEASHLDYLVNLGCEYGQGYYFDKPMSAKDVENLLRNDEGFGAKRGSNTAAA